MKKKQRTTSSSTRKEKTRIFRVFSIVLLIAALDQVSKHYITKIFPLGSTYEVVKGFLYLTHLENSGVSFGMLKGYNIVFVIIACIALAFFMNVYTKNKRYWVQLSFIFAGIIGNLIDRISLGYVVDFIDFRFFPVFNVADSAISIGVVWLVLLAIRNKEDLM